MRRKTKFIFKNLNISISKKTFVISSLVGSVVLIGGVYLGSKYLNVSRGVKNGLESRVKNLQIENSKLKIQLDNAGQKSKERNARIYKLTNALSSKSYIQVNISTLEDDIKTYHQLSPSIQKVIIEQIVKTSKKYNINPLIIYSLIHTESSMRFQIQHGLVHLKIDGKRVNTRAVGLGGIIWEWWGSQLRRANIAQARSDLFLPVINIKAIGYILNAFYKMHKLPGCKTKDESMLRRYFGGNFKSYSDKIDRKIMSLVRPTLYR